MLKITMPGVNPYRQALLDAFSPQRFAAAMATAMTRTAVEVRKAGQQDIAAKFDRPTPYTVRQLRYVAATAQKPAAAVGFDIAAITDISGNVVAFRSLGEGETPASNYMEPNIQGQQRRLKGLEVALRAINALPTGWFVVPGQGATLDAYGNVSRGQVVQVLSQLRIQLVAGSSRNMSGNASKAIAAQRRAGGRFFVIKPGGKVAPGVYQREFMGQNITPVFVFVKRAAYRQRMDFYGDARRRADALLPDQASRAIDEQLARIKALR